MDSLTIQRVTIEYTLEILTFYYITLRSLLSLCYVYLLNPDSAEIFVSINYGTKGFFNLKSSSMS